MPVEELREALAALWRAYCAVNAEKMGRNDLPFIQDDGGKAYAQLGEWWYGPDAIEPNHTSAERKG